MPDKKQIIILKRRKGSTEEELHEWCYRKRNEPYTYTRAKARAKVKKLNKSAKVFVYRVKTIAI